MVKLQPTPTPTKYIAIQPLTRRVRGSTAVHLNVLRYNELFGVVTLQRLFGAIKAQSYEH